jgi:hypothetical protein
LFSIKHLLSKHLIQIQTCSLYDPIIFLFIEDLAQQKLAGSGLHEDSLIDFLKVAHELVKMNIEDTISKTAELGEVKNLGLSVAGDILFNPMGASSMALLPGNVLDGLIFNKIQKSLTKKKKPVSDNNLKGE